MPVSIWEDNEMRVKHTSVSNYAIAFLAAVLAMTLLFVTLAVPASVTAQTADTPTPEATVVQEYDQGVEDLPPLEGKLNPPQFPDMDANLNRIVEQFQTGQFTAQAAAASAPIHREESVAVTLYVTEGYALDVWDWLEDSGASPRSSGVDYIEAYIPVSLLPEASEREGVNSIRTIIPAQPAQGTVVSEGVGLHGATAWHSAGLKGQAVKIGIIDGGFEGFSSLMGTELPASVKVRCYTDIGVFTSRLADCENDDEHGTAVTEAAFDIAPEASYYIANPLSFGDLSNTVDWMNDQDVVIINHSRGWIWDGPGDGTSPYDGSIPHYVDDGPPYSNSPLRAVDKAVSGGVTWVNAVGNAAQTTWFGDFTDADNDDLHEFSGADVCNAVQLRAGERHIFQLRWDDSWGGASKDLELQLFQVNTFSSPTLVGSSTAYQSGGDAHVPSEAILYTPTLSGTYCLAVQKFSGATPDWIQLQVFDGPELEHHTLSHSIGSPAESANPGLLAVGAAPASDINTIEPFSSQGPTPDGRTKPDIVGVDMANSETLGRWPGTSQASPHVAGLAALVKQNNPNYTPQQVANYLKTNAEPRGAASPNNIWGHGFARLPAVSTTTPDLVVETPTVSDSSPNMGASFTLNATVRNSGSGAATTTTIRYYQSTDATITTSDTSVGTDSVGGLAASGSSAQDISLTTPDTAGTYYYGACVDAVTDESNTTNNCSAAVTVTVVAASAPSSDATLSSLTVSPVDIVGFGNQGNTYDIYHVGVAYSVAQATITAVATNPAATIEIDGSAVSNGSPHSVFLEEGLNRSIVRVTSQDGSTTRLYRIYVGRGVVASYGWKASDDFNTLLSSGNASPIAIWSDGTTMWVADSEDDKIYAYDLGTKARDASKDFDTLSGAENNDAAGIWSDGTTVYVADSEDDKIYAYNLGTKARDAFKDFDTLSGAGNNYPTGIWSDGTTMYVADYTDDKIYAYNLSSRARDAANDLNSLASAGNNNPWGLWSDGATMWAADYGMNKVFAYHLSGGSRDTSKDFNTLEDSGHYVPAGLWSDGTTMWVASNAAVTKKIYSYNMQLSSDATPGRIAFSYFDGNSEIYVMNADGSDVKNLTNNSANDYSPAWSPDGNRIAFYSGRDGNSEIYVMKADGSDVKNLTNNSTNDVSPAWSPDGNKIAFVSERDGTAGIYVMNADGSGVTRLTNNSTSNHEPAWSADGRRIAFYSGRDGSGEIYVMNADGSGVKNLTNNSAVDSMPAWSPDGNRIAFHSDRDGNSEIYVMKADGSDVKNLTNNSAYDLFPAWSPDGKKIAFYSDRDGNEGIYVMNADGSGVTRLYGSGSEPAWSPVGAPAAPSPDDAYLSSLTVSPVDIAGFDSARAEYHVGVVNSVTQAAITAIASDANATIDINGSAVTSGSPHSVSLSEGRNEVTIAVTASDGQTVETYSVVIGRGVTTDFGWKATEDFNTLVPRHDHPSGIWSDGATMWIANYSTIPVKIYAYNMSTKARDASKDFNNLIVTGNGTVTGNAQPSGMWSDGTTMWVADWIEGKIYAYDMATKARDASKDFDTLTAAGNDGPRGIWSDGTTMWVVNHNNDDDKVFAYNLATKARDASKDINTLRSDGNQRAFGIWSDGTTLWVGDSLFLKLYAYDLATKSRDPSKDFNQLFPTLSHIALDIWSDGATMWVTDRYEKKLYSYNMPVAAQPTPVPSPTPQPTSTPEPQPPADACIEPLTGDGAVSGTWTSDCASESKNGSYARYYTFTLAETAEVTITLESSEDTYLFLLQGAGRDGSALHENDDHASESYCAAAPQSQYDSCITVSLDAGDYTIEATTFNASTTGNFMLTVSGLPAAAGTQPTPQPTSTPVPTTTPTPQPTTTPAPTPQPTTTPAPRITRLTHNDSKDTFPAWAPDRRRIAFVSDRDGNDEIYVMNVDGSGVTRLTDNNAEDHVPAWSPDGRRIAFVSDRDGNNEIYVMNANGSGVTRLTDSNAEDHAPTCRPMAGVSHSIPTAMGMMIST